MDGIFPCTTMSGSLKKKYFNKYSAAYLQIYSSELPWIKKLYRKHWKNHQEMKIWIELQPTTIAKLISAKENYTYFAILLIFMLHNTQGTYNNNLGPDRLACPQALDPIYCRQLTLWLHDLCLQVLTATDATWNEIFIDNVWYSE